MIVTVRIMVAVYAFAQAMLRLISGSGEPIIWCFMAAKLVSAFWTNPVVRSELSHFYKV